MHPPMNISNMMKNRPRRAYKIVFEDGESDMTVEKKEKTSSSNMFPTA